jgi:hypothetical protein
MFQFTDDDQTGLNKLTLTVSTIQVFHDSVNRILNSWRSFEAQDIQIFELPPQNPRRKRWDEYLASIKRHIKELSSYEGMLTYKLETFKGMRVAVSL